MQTKPGPAKLSSETRVAKALAHPLRAEILLLLNEQTCSPLELSRLTDNKLENIAYHVRVLRDLDCIELVDTAPRRGATEHFYRATTRALLTEDDWVRLPASAQRAFTRMGLKTTVADIIASFQAGTFDQRSDHHNSFTRLVLDEEGFTELADKLLALLDDAMSIEAASAARLINGAEGGAEVRTRLVLMQYQPPAAKG